MNILLFEYVTGGGLAAEDLPPSLLREGERMVNALLQDLVGERVWVLRDWRLPPPHAAVDGQRVEYVGLDVSFQQCWNRALSWAEAVWLIAPETGKVLERFSTAVIQAGKLLLGSRPPAVAVAGDKYHSTLHLSAAGIGCIPSWTLARFAGQVPPPWVVKPRDGVGCDGVRKLERLPEGPDDLLVQPFIEGESMSLSAVFAAGNAVCISVNRQQVEDTGEGFRLRGCQVNTLEPDGQWQVLCSQVAAALPDLWGYVGIDLILTGEKMVVVEINPRITLSYVGLSQALGGGLARHIVAMARQHESLADIAAWRRDLGRGKEVWIEA